MSMAGGLASQGMIPVVALYSTFLQRAYDMILQDVAMMKLHVVLAIDRAGLVGEDGETHHGLFDVGFLRQIPGVRLLAPGSILEMQEMLTWAVEEQTQTVAIRYPKGGDGSYQGSAWAHASVSVCRHREGSDVTLITYGSLLDNVLQAADSLAQQGIQASVLRLLSLSPLPVSQLTALISSQKVVIIEETCTGSGIREELAWLLKEQAPQIQVSGLDLGKQYITHGCLDRLYAHYGLDARSIASFVQEVLRHEN